MPLYDVACTACGAVEEIFRSFRDYDDLPDHCGEPMRRQVCAPFVQCDIQPYRSMVDGKMISSRSAHRNMLKDNGLIEVGDQMHHMKPKPMAPPPGLKETLIQVANEKLRSKP